jgi:pimeloyl-ACP methyl ester carboxylesterase
LRRRLIVAGVVLVIATIGALIATWAIQRFVTFPSPPAGSANPAARTAAGGRIVWLDVDGARVEAWLLPAQGTAAALIIYSHGNGELIDMRAADFDALRAAGYAVLQVEYPGYGRSAGSPSEASVTAALVLESTFVNLEDVVMSYGVPRALLLYHFDTAAVLRSYPGPVLLIHGTADRVFPVEDARILASTAKHARLHLEDCGHADCAPQWDLVLGFLRGNLLNGPEAS